MTWACRYCTFANHDDTSTTCCLCGMPGKRTLPSAREPKTAKDDDPEIIDITDTANDKKLPVKSHSSLPTASVSTSTVQDAAANDAPTTSRKRKAPHSTCITTTNNNNDGEIHGFFTNNADLRRSHKNSTKPAPSTIKSVQQTATIHCRYPHSFSYHLVPKRTSQEAKQDIRKTLDSIFKLRKLRNLQPHAINCALRLDSQMIVMATGGGKYVQNFTIAAVSFNFPNLFSKKRFSIAQIADRFAINFQRVCWEGSPLSSRLSSHS